MPEEKKQEEFKVNKSMNDLSNTKDVLSMMQSALNTPSGKKLVTELREIQQELKGRGLKLEDQLIVGTKTLKDSVKDWDKKGLSDEAIVQYAALYIGACNNKEIPATYICPKSGLKQKERNFNQPEVFGGKQAQKEVGTSILDAIWDAVCSLFGITTAHAKDVQMRDHRKMVDKIRSANMQPFYEKANQESYLQAKETLDNLNREDEKWQELFFGSEIPLEITETMKQKRPELHDMSPLDACMKMAAAQIEFSEDMTPEKIKENPEQMKTLHLIAQNYNNMVKHDDAMLMASETSKKSKPMKFVELGEAMQEAADKSGNHPYRKNGDRKLFNPEYNPMQGEKLEEKIRMAAPMLKRLNYGVGKMGKVSCGALLIKERIGAMEDAVKSYEALKARDYEGVIRLSCKVADHMSRSTTLQQMMCGRALGIMINIKDGNYYTAGKDIKLGDTAGSQMGRCMEGSGSDIGRYMNNTFNANQHGRSLTSPIGAAMMISKSGLDGKIANYSKAVSREELYNTSHDPGTSWKNSRINVDDLNRSTQEYLEEADAMVETMEKSKQNEAWKKTQDTEKSKENEEPVMVQ